LAFSVEPGSVRNKEFEVGFFYFVETDAVGRRVALAVNATYLE
jgi:hypothetical protein